MWVYVETAHFGFKFSVCIMHPTMKRFRPKNDALNLRDCQAIILQLADTWKGTMNFLQPLEWPYKHWGCSRMPMPQETTGGSLVFRPPPVYLLGESRSIRIRIACTANLLGQHG